jgi:hypothetical protein
MFFNSDRPGSLPGMGGMSNHFSSSAESDLQNSRAATAIARLNA